MERVLNRLDMAGQPDCDSGGATHVDDHSCGARNSVVGRNGEFVHARRVHPPAARAGGRHPDHPADFWKAACLIGAHASRSIFCRGAALDIDDLPNRRSGPWLAGGRRLDDREVVRLRRPREEPESDARQRSAIAAWQRHVVGWKRPLVPWRGLEPPRRETHGPEPCASTNSATRATDGRRSLGESASTVNREGGARMVSGRLSTVCGAFG